MRTQQRSARDYMPAECAAGGSCPIDALRAAARGCRGCDLYLHATQTVFGDGAANARLVLVGEVPGDEEDLAGEPFVGDAGRLLDELLEAARIPRDAAWVTNAVKHFKFERRGSRRIHLKPTMVEVGACRPWLDAELDAIDPEVVVLLGATAAQSLLGRDFRITKARGEWAGWQRPARVLATWHPSAVLRAPEREDRHRMRAELLDDLRKVARVLR